MKKILVILALLLVPSIALAVPQLNFDNPTLDGGTISYDGAGGALIGADIIFQQVIGVDTPLNPGVSLYCSPDPCELDFVTGVNTLEGGPIYTFAGGGSLTLTGGLNTAADGSGAQIVPAGTALAHTGTFDDPSLVLAGTSLGFAGAGFDLKNDLLTAFYGITAPEFRFINTEFSVDGGATIDPTTRGFDAIVSDADFSNTAVPEPATLLLLGTGLVGAAAFTRRMRRQKLPG